MDSDVTSTLIVNKLRGTFTVVATKAPEFGDAQKAALQDMAILTGARFYSKDLGMQLKDVTIDDLGKAKRITVKKDSTTIVGGEGLKKDVEDRISELQAQYNVVSSEYDKKNIAKRIAKLSNGVAVLKVGALTESELKDKKLRIEDALNATKAAVAEGVVVGGGAALAEVYMALKGTLKDSNPDIQKGIDAVIDSLLAPLMQIAANAGYDPKEIADKQKEQEKNFGFDALHGNWVNMFDANIIDPTKVTRNAILNSSSISAMFVTTEAAVTEIKEDKPAPAMNPAGMY